LGTSPSFFAAEIVDFDLSLDISKTFLSFGVDREQLWCPPHFWKAVPDAEVLILHLFPLSIASPYTSPPPHTHPAPGALLCLLRESTKLQTEGKTPRAPLIHLPRSGVAQKDKKQDRSRQPTTDGLFLLNSRTGEVNQVTAQ